jgi:hypothetical protein
LMKYHLSSSEVSKRARDHRIDTSNVKSLVRLHVRVRFWITRRIHEFKRRRAVLRNRDQKGCSKRETQYMIPKRSDHDRSTYVV